MLSEVLEQLGLKEGSVACDCTLGGAGHSVELAAAVGKTGFDRPTIRSQVNTR